VCSVNAGQSAAPTPTRRPKPPTRSGTDKVRRWSPQ
jgi:hypothetical protein